MTKPPHWTMEQIGDLTLPQIAILANGGAMPRPRRRDFASMDEAIAWAIRSAPADPVPPPPNGVPDGTSRRD